MNDSNSPAPSVLSRRRLIQSTGLGLLGWSMWPARTMLAAVAPSGQDAAADSRAIGLNRFPEMMQQWWVAKLAEIERQGDARRAAIIDRTAAERYVREVQERARSCFGALPERTPLRPRIVRVTDRGAYRIEHVIFESRPGFLVTGNLYVPTVRSGLCPAVLGEFGHAGLGKADARYQAFAQALVLRGCVVFLIDPIGQGERSQYVNDRRETTVRPGTRQHLLAGGQQVLVDEFFGTWRAWDGIRALDYLESRPEVDAKRLGVTGHSGGGTLTTWLCALDPRWAVAAPVCFVTTFRHNLENELSADTEQYPPRALALGLDHADFLLGMAPKPVLLLGEEKDFFDVRGLEESVRRLKATYELLGAPQAIGSHIAPGYHGYSDENQREMLAWFGQAFGLGQIAPLPKSKAETESDLWCTPHGQVAELGARTVFSFTAERSRLLAAARPNLRGEQIAECARRLLKMPERTGAPHYRILRPIVAREYPTPHVASYAVETERGVAAIVYRLHKEDPKEELVTRPPRVGGEAMLYISHQSADLELRRDPFVRALVEKSAGAVFTCDVRGVGESRPQVGGLPYRGPDTSDLLYAAHALMLDYPYLGQRTHDVLRVIDWLEACGHTHVHLCGAGWGALPATFAALLSPMVKRVTLQRALTSYAAVAETEDYHVPVALMLPGVLREFDLPDCYRALAPKGLEQIDPWTPDVELP